MRLAALLVAVALAAGACDSPETATTSTPTGATSSSLGPVISDRLVAELQLEELAGRVESLRELEFLQPVTVSIVDDDDFRARAIALASPPVDLDGDVAAGWLRLLGVLPPETTVYAATGRLLQTGAALYDRTSNAVLVRAGAGLDAYVEAAVVHEMVHALHHQHYGTPRLPAVGEPAYVYRALSEGDARRITDQFIDQLDPAARNSFEEGALTADEDATAIRASTPAYVRDLLTLPVSYGARFLTSNQQADSHLAAFADGVPVSSEELIVTGADTERLDPELRPVTVLPYEPFPVVDTLGAGTLQLLFRQVLLEGLAGTAVVGWGGDAVDIRVDGSEVILAYAFRGETAADAEEVAAAFRLLLDTRLTDGAYAAVRVDGDTTLVLAASDPSVAPRLDDLFGNFGDEVFVVELGG